MYSSYDPVVGGGGCHPLHEVVAYVLQKPRLEGGDAGVSSGAGRSSNAMVGRVIGAERARQELGAQHA